jgi:hypothetical protein
MVARVRCLPKNHAPPTNFSSPLGYGRHARPPTRGAYRQRVPSKATHSIKRDSKQQTNIPPTAIRGESTSTGRPRPDGPCHAHVTRWPHTLFQRAVRHVHDSNVITPFISNVLSWKTAAHSFREISPSRPLCANLARRLSPATNSHGLESTAPLYAPHTKRTFTIALLAQCPNPGRRRPRTRTDGRAVQWP